MRSPKIINKASKVIVKLIYKRSILVVKLIINVEAGV